MVVFGNQKGFSVIGLLFKLVVLCMVLYLVNRFYPSFILCRDTRQFLKREGINTAGMKRMVESFKDKAGGGALKKYSAKQKQTMDSMFDQGK